MNAALLALLLVAPDGIGEGDPERMTVVLRTVDGKRTVQRCMQSNLTPAQLPSGSNVVEPGRVTWHVNGGRAPYTLVRDERDLAGNVCITLRDADGREATGCGIIGVQDETVLVDCARGTHLNAGNPVPTRWPKRSDRASSADTGDLYQPMTKEHHTGHSDLDMAGGRPRELTQKRPEQGPRGGGSGQRPVRTVPQAVERR